MELEGKMQYAIRLASPDWQPESEDLLKLTSLLGEIEQLLSSAAAASPAIETEFRQTVKACFESRGAFRQEVEGHPHVKDFIQRL